MIVGIAWIWYNTSHNFIIGKDIPLHWYPTQFPVLVVSLAQEEWSDEEYFREYRWTPDPHFEEQFPSFVQDAQLHKLTLPKMCWTIFLGPLYHLSNNWYIGLSTVEI